MTQFIRCPSCSRNFAPYMDFFDKARQAQHQEEVFGKDSDVKNYDPIKLTLLPGSANPCENIFDAIGITNRCCRMRMFSKIEPDKMYK